MPAGCTAGLRSLLCIWWESYRRAVVPGGLGLYKGLLHGPSPSPSPSGGMYASCTAGCVSGML